MKCRAEVKVAAVEPVKWEFPCFAKKPGSELMVWAYAESDSEPDDFIGINVNTGDCDYRWDKKQFVPMAKAETEGWRVVCDNGGCRLEKGVAAEPVKPEYPWLGRHKTYEEGYETLFFGDGATPGTAVAGSQGWRGYREGEMLPIERAENYEPISGSVTIANRAGVEFPRLYRAQTNGCVYMRTAVDVWWRVNEAGELLVPGNGTDHARLETHPKDTPLPDGSTLTLTFTA